MGVVQLTILTMVNMMGSGISCCRQSLPKLGQFQLSPGWYSRRLNGTGMGIRKMRYVQPKSGGMGGYAEYAFGKSGNFMRTTPTVSRC